MSTSSATAISTAADATAANGRLRKPEIMSPAGYWPQLHAAIEAGADAVYFGLTRFTARAKVGFSPEELPSVMQTLHRRGVKGYVTLNTLVFDNELGEAADLVAGVAAAGADSVIVQDVGFARLIKDIAPSLAVHGSTQMSITSAEGVEQARRTGVDRVVLARELSLDEVRAIRRQTDCELEIFVHGALCVSYSGQCFSSEAWGGRSANRGQCAQACRLPYEMIVDGELRPLADARYLLSPGDLYALRQMPEIVQIGISALKIEGRYKDANYVALTTAAYRQAVDEAWAGRPLSIDPAGELRLEQVYSRGLGPWFMEGTNHQTVVQGRSPRHRGVWMGTVRKVVADRVVLDPSPAHEVAPLKPGDGIVFDAANWRSPQEDEEGGHIYEIFSRRDEGIELTFGNGAIDFQRIRPGDLLWRSHDHDVDKAARPWLEPAAPVTRQPVQVQVKAHAGESLQIAWTVAAQPEITVTVFSPEPLTTAQRQGLTTVFLEEQLGRLGNTPYRLESLTCDQAGNPFIPSSLLNQLRRQATEELARLQGDRLHHPTAEPQAILAAALTQVRQAAPVSANAPSLHLLVRTPEQLAAALPLRPASITLDYLELYGLRPAVEQIAAAGITARVASPRVLKPNEQRVVNFLLRLGCPILVRSAGLLEALQVEGHPALIGDFSLNTANVLTAEHFLQLGIDRLTPGHDLNAAQTAALARRIGGEALEVIAYQHLPVFHTEHCIFCRFLSTGTSFKDCGHPCETHRVALRDQYGRAHPVMADVGCRNTVFGAEAQTAARHLDEWRRTGIAYFRLEFVHESGAQVAAIVGAFQAALQGAIDPGELERRLLQTAPQGITEGSLFVPPGGNIELVM